MLERFAFDWLISLVSQLRQVTKVTRQHKFSSSNLYIYLCEYKYLHPLTCRKNVQSPKAPAEHNAKASTHNSVNILEPLGNVTTMYAIEYTHKTLIANKPHLRSNNQKKNPQTTNQQQAVIAAVNLPYNHHSHPLM